ncbi:hypothetical protein H9Q72_009392 [Fusarium xylarioides]|uniref:FAD-binding PCMH-type domain-containing protein n=1 Tax=Fusarium xylarioides TaxID=221167 RepID=A0A9P7HUR7_9HYPO|nr:hypothetical protein H9Q72_009392 [Fusarium xylarioides]
MPHPIIFNGSLGLGLMLVGLGLNATLRPNDHLQRLEFPIPTEPLAKRFSLALMKIWGIRNITVGVLISIIWATGNENLMAKALTAALAMPITDGFRNLKMRLLSNFSLPALAVIGLFATSGYAEDQCRCTIGESCWPSAKTWGSLNSTVDGHLIRYIPPGAVCYKYHPSYSPIARDEVIKQWSESKFHSSDPASLHTEWGNAGCTPVYENGTSIYGDVETGTRGCSNGGLPAYVVNATTVDHGVAALEFAGEHNIRLVIKNTGHAGNGRNLGNSSLSIWTHNLKSIDLQEDFNLTCPNAQDAPSPRMAATVGAGVQDGEMHEALAAQNALAVGGTSNDVGVVGWATGGGHGFATGKYGQGADNILEAEIVTPAGKVLIVNQCQNQDLYWAIRGGGGGTFGVITKLTVKAYPAPKVVIGGYDIRAKNQTSEEEFYEVIADAHALFPTIQDAGIHGYYTVTGPPEAEALTFSGSFMGFDISNKTYDDALEPFRKMLDASNSTVTWSLTKIPVRLGGMLVA